MRFSVNERAAKVWERVKKECEERKIPKEQLENILSEAFISIPSDFWKAEIDRHTPPTFYLELAMRDPKIAKQVVDFLKGKQMSTEVNERKNQANA